MFFALNVPPGRHMIGTEKGVPVPIELHSGEDSFVELGWHSQIGQQPIPMLFSVPPSQARTKLKYLAYINKSKIQSPSVSETDPREQPNLQLKQREKSQ